MYKKLNNSIINISTPSEKHTYTIRTVHNTTTKEGFTPVDAIYSLCKSMGRTVVHCEKTKNENEANVDVFIDKGVKSRHNYYILQTEPKLSVANLNQQQAQIPHQPTDSKTNNQKQKTTNDQPTFFVNETHDSFTFNTPTKNKTIARYQVSINSPDIQEQHSLTLVIEDRGSAREIIKTIVEYYAKANKINIDLTMLIASGVSNISDVLYYCDTTNIDNILVLFDMIDSQSVIYNSISKEITSIQSSGRNIETIIPYCIEELCLSFYYLQVDIQNLTPDNYAFLKNIYKHYKGCQFEYLERDIDSGNLLLNGQSIALDYPATFIKKYKTINSTERFLAEKLAEITYNNPYSFNKAASICWYKTCIQQLCQNRLNRTIYNTCNKNLLGKNKIEHLINESLFGLIYDSINVLFYGGSDQKIDRQVADTYKI